MHRSFHFYFSFTQTLVNFVCIKYNEIYVGLYFLRSDHLDDLDQRHCHEALR